MSWEQQFNIVPEVLVDKTIQGYTESPNQIGVVGGSCTLDLTNGTVLFVTLTASTLCTFTMPTPVAGKSFILFVKQPVGTGGQGSVAFPDVHWSYNLPPTITATSGKQDIFTFFSDGATWFGNYTLNYSSGDQDPSAVAKSVLPNQSSANYPVLYPIRRAMRGRSNSRR